MRQVEWKGKTKETVRGLDPDVRRALGYALYLLQTDPLVAFDQCDIRKMKREPNVWRIRVGVWRLIYTVRGDFIIVTTVSRRSNVYS